MPLHKTVYYSANNTDLGKLLQIMGVNKNVELISFEVIEMEKRRVIKIGPEIPLEYIDKIQTHSSSISFECIRIVSDSPKKLL